MANVAYDNLELMSKNIMYVMENDLDFLRLISIDKRNALDLTPTLSYDDLIMDRIYPKYPNITTTTNQKSIVAVKHWSTIPVNKSKAIYNIEFLVDVVCHEGLWLLNDGLLRPYRLKSKLIDSILKLNIPSLDGTPTLVSDREIIYKNDFSGYRLIFSWKSFSGWNNNV